VRPVLSIATLFGRKDSLSWRPNGIILVVNTELDRPIHDKRLQLKDALAACQKARADLAHAEEQLAAVAPDAMRDAQAGIQNMESEERDAANRFRTISDELARLHRGKYGKWHITWGRLRPSP
jgi:hypothetical protein